MCCLCEHRDLNRIQFIGALMIFVGKICVKLVLANLNQRQSLKCEFKPVINLICGKGQGNLGWKLLITVIRCHTTSTKQLVSNSCFSLGVQVWRLGETELILWCCQLVYECRMNTLTGLIFFFSKLVLRVRNQRQLLLLLPLSVTLDLNLMANSFCLLKRSGQTLYSMSISSAVSK